MLGRQPVVDRDDDDPGAPRDRPGGAVVRLDAADHPAAAVEVHERHARLVGLHGPVDADRHAVRVDVLDRVHLVELAPLLLALLDVLRTELLRRQRARRLDARRRLLLEHGLYLGVEDGRRHGPRFYVGGVT